MFGGFLCQEISSGVIGFGYVEVNLHTTQQISREVSLENVQNNVLHMGAVPFLDAHALREVQSSVLEYWRLLDIRACPGSGGYSSEKRPRI